MSDAIRWTGIVLGSFGFLLHLALLFELRYRRNHDLPIWRPHE